MGGRQPKSIFTDQDQAMSNAISVVFETSRHRLCLWHISKNATQHIAQLYAILEFKKKFNLCLYGFLSEDEFECAWADLIETFNLSGHKWLNHLYSLRGKWSPAYNLDIFSIGMKSSQRSESTNSVFTGMSKKNMRLTEFVLHYEDQKNKMRDAENEEDFRSRHGVHPKSKRGCSLVKQAGTIYTRTIFNKFLAEWEVLTELDISGEFNEGTTFIFLFKENGSTSLKEVRIDALNDYISCSCKKFEYLGILCRHALRGMLQKGMKEIPSRYILHRWTKFAKHSHTRDTFVSEESMVKEMTSSDRRSDLTHLSYQCIELATQSKGTYEILKSKLTDSLNELTHELDVLKIKESGSELNVDVNLNSTSIVLDPAQSRCKEDQSSLSPFTTFTQVPSINNLNTVSTNRQFLSQASVEMLPMPQYHRPWMTYSHSSVVGTSSTQVPFEAHQLVPMCMPRVYYPHVPFEEQNRAHVQENNMTTSTSVQGHLEFNFEQVHGEGYGCQRPNVE